MSIQVPNNIIAAGLFKGAADPSPFPRFWNARGVDTDSFVRGAAGTYTINLEPIEGASIGGCIALGQALDGVEALNASFTVVPRNAADLTEGYMLGVQTRNNADALVDADSIWFLVVNYETGEPTSTDQEIIDAGGP